MDQEKRSVLNCLFRLAWADGDFGAEEKSVLDRLMSRMGLSRSEIMNEINAHSQGPPEDDGGLNITDPESKREAMKMILMVCFADQQIPEGEVEFIAPLALRLGFTAAQLQELRGEVEQALTPEHREAGGFQASISSQAAKQPKKSITPLKLD